jgi:arsenate reductase
MTEIGIDVSQEFPKPVTGEVVRAADVVGTKGCRDALPVYSFCAAYFRWRLSSWPHLPSVAPSRTK